MRSATTRKSMQSAVTYSEGDPTIPTPKADNSGEGGSTPPIDPNANPNGRGGGPVFPGTTGPGGRPQGADPGSPGWPAPITTGTPGTGTPASVVGPPTIDEAARARDQQDASLRRRGRRNSLVNGRKGAGVPDVVIAGLTGMGGNPNRRKPGYNFPGTGGEQPGTNENPNGRPDPTGNPIGRKGPSMFPGGRKSYGSF